MLYRLLYRSLRAVNDTVAIKMSLAFLKDLSPNTYQMVTAGLVVVNLCATTRKV